MSTDSLKDGRMKDIIQDLAAKFIQLESNYTSLVTVTDIILSDRSRRADVLVTVLPEEKEEDAVDFLKRKRSEFRQYVMDKSKLARIPFFDFEIDHGEKNRQKIDRISNSVESKGAPAGAPDKMA